MKTILCFGDSNLWGGIPGVFDPSTGLAGRYPKNQRWTGILQEQLGRQANVIEEGMNARTTNLDEIIPGRPYKNALTYLPFCLEAHYPIDLVIFMLGTNDTKIQFSRSIKEIGEGIRQLIEIVKRSNKGPDATAPKILLIAPTPIIQTPGLHPQLDETSIEKSKLIPNLYRQITIDENCYFLDASEIVTASTIDGVHLDAPQCELLGHTTIKIVKKILSL